MIPMMMKKKMLKTKMYHGLHLRPRLPKIVDIVVICLPSPEPVAYVVEPRNGLLEGLSPQ